MKISVGSILIILLVSLVAAQDGKVSPSQKSKPNLSGRWILDFSTDSKGKSVKATSEIVLVVKQEEPEIIFLENAGGEKEQELKYYADGRGEENPSEISISAVSRSSDPTQFDEKLRSKTKWDGDKLVARALLQRVVNGHTYSMEVVKEWKLSKDGNALTLTMRRTNRNASALEIRGPGITRSDMTNETKMVYRRST